MAFQNGVPQQSSTGAWAGGLTFFGYTPGDVTLASLNMTGYGQAAVDPDTVRLVDHSTQLPDGLALALHFNMGTNAMWGVGIDAFDGLITYGEVLTIGKVIGSNPGAPAPAMNMSGLTAGAWTGEYVRERWKNPLLGYQSLTRNAGSVQFNNSEINSTMNFGDWTWTRLRIEDAGGGNKRRRVKNWGGAYSNEPVAWGFDNTAGNSIGAPANAIGYAAEGSGGTTDGVVVMGYFSFSENPAAVTPPSPAEIGSGTLPSEYLARLRWGV